MKFFITGGHGQLGYDVIKTLEENGYTEYYAPSQSELDITNRETTIKSIKEYNPDVIIHCAAYTQVDKAEEEKEVCYNVNVNGTKYIAEAAKELKSKMVYISTDYVFDGEKEGLYLPNDKTNPINYYGYTKREGENIVKELDDYIIVRISWVFGINGKNFVKTMLRIAEGKDELNVVSDQIGSPTYTEDLSKLLLQMITNDKKGIYHATNEGYCSWYEFAKYIFEINNIDIKVNPILTKDYITLAKRPLNSKLSKDILDSENLDRLPDWKDATERYCKILRREK